MAAKPKKDILLRIEPDDAIVFKGNFSKEVTVSFLDLFKFEQLIFSNHFVLLWKWYEK